MQTKTNENKLYIKLTTGYLLRKVVLPCVKDPVVILYTVQDDSRGRVKWTYIQTFYKSGITVNHFEQTLDSRVLKRIEKFLNHEPETKPELFGSFASGGVKTFRLDNRQHSVHVVPGYSSVEKMMFYSLPFNNHDHRVDCYSLKWLEDLAFASIYEKSQIFCKIYSVAKKLADEAKAKEHQKTLKTHEINLDHEFNVTWSIHHNGAYVEKYGPTALYTGELVFYANTCFQHESDFLKQQNFHIPQSVLDKALKLILQCRCLDLGEVRIYNHKDKSYQILKAEKDDRNDSGPDYEIKWNSTEQHAVLLNKKWPRLLNATGHVYPKETAITHELTSPWFCPEFNWFQLVRPFIMNHRPLKTNEFRTWRGSACVIIEAKIVKIKDKFRMQIKSTIDSDDMWSLPFKPHKLSNSKNLFHKFLHTFYVQEVDKLVKHDDNQKQKEKIDYCKCRVL